MIEPPIVGGEFMVRPLSAHVEIVEKDPIKRTLSVGFLGEPPPVFENWTLGIKWSWRGTWYGFWGEYAPGKRLQAYLLLVYYFFKFTLIRKAPALHEVVDPGRTFLLT